MGLPNFKGRKSGLPGFESKWKPCRRMNGWTDVCHNNVPFAFLKKGGDNLKTSIISKPDTIRVNLLSKSKKKEKK